MPEGYETIIDSWGTIRLPTSRILPQGNVDDDGRAAEYSAAGPAWGALITVSDTPPSNPQVGDLWIDTSP